MDKKKYLYDLILRAERLQELEKKAGIKDAHTSDLLRELVEQWGSFEFEELRKGLEGFYATDDD